MVAPNTVIPPFSRVAGRPGVVIEELPETAQESLERMFAAVIAYRFGWFARMAETRRLTYNNNVGGGSEADLPHGVVDWR